ncbi:porin [Arcobacter porcinus]|uniref:porin n=1 Tax=Arcobacter porcinus TaxID=1935204 RepID=UPI00081E4D6C|nr:porin [Arcobacter porcinus]OCL83981.1 Major outer membrane protein precursor [Arcobacter porcinus]
MKKITKLSLVAAVAVAGLTSASAKPLEEAIKNVDVSGSVVYRYDNFGNDKQGEKQNTNKYKIGLNLSSKVNDYVKFNSRAIIGGENNDMVGLNKAEKPNGDSDANPDLVISQAYFGLSAIPNTTVNIGKQALATPWTVAQDINGGEQTGTGILAITAIDNYVAGAGYFNQTSLDKLTDGLAGIVDGSKDIYVATLQANFDYINVQGWYLNAVDQFDTYTFVVDGKVQLAEKARLGYEARYVSLDADDLNLSDKNSLLRVAVDGKFDIVNARIAYTKTDKKGGLTALDADAKNASLGWRLNTVNKADAKYYQLALGADILDNLNFTAHYGNLEYNNGTKVKQNEIYGQLTYKMSKNLSTYVRYGQVELDKDNKSTVGKENSGRIQVAYTF